MTDRIINVTIDDAEGRPHQYAIVLMEPEHGMAVMMRLYAMAAGPLGEALRGAMSEVDSLLSGVLDGSPTVTELLDDPKAASSLVGVLQAIDLGAVGKDVQMMLVDPQVDTAGLVRTMLAEVRRDNQRLGDSVAFNEAFRGNYFEMMKAAWEVVKANRFFPAFGGSGGTAMDGSSSSRPTSGEPSTPPPSTA